MLGVKLFKISSSIFKQLIRVSYDLKTISLSSWRSLKYESGNPLRIVNIENKFPYIEPVLPLRYSSKSGFFFCGIIEDPVTTLSDKFIKLKPSELHIINSSAILDMCIEHTEALYKKSRTKSLSETVSIELFVEFLKPNFFVV